jgi:hypothetical protein
MYLTLLHPKIFCNNKTAEDIFLTLTHPWVVYLLL